MAEDEQSVNGDGPGRDDEPGEMYFNKAKGEMRRRRGHKKGIRRGPYSVEECEAIAAFDKWLVSERKMHGYMGQPSSRDVAVFLARATAINEEYSYENCPDPIGDGIDPHIVAKRLDAYIAALPETGGDVFENVEMQFDQDDLALQNLPYARVGGRHSAGSADVPSAEFTVWNAG
jgi:hypothetical protein